MASRPPIYLDHQATTPLDPRVLDAMLPSLREDFGNAASVTHAYGWRAEALVEDARERIASAIGAEPAEIVFTSGATESNNLAILGTVASRSRGRPTRLLTLATEHLSVLDPCRFLASQGHQLRELPVGSDGLADVEEVDRALADDPLLLSVMAANNEIGVLQPLDEIARICDERGVLLHCDAAQAVGKIPLRVDELPIDLLSISGHKLYGPKGIGALYVRTRRPRLRPEPLIHGGGHERGMRSGTLPVPLIVGMARALELCLEELEAEGARLRELRERLWKRLSTELDGVRLNGSAQRRLPNNLNVCFRGVDADRLLLALPDVALSTGSACSSALPQPSHVLAALGLSESEVRGSVRIGLGRSTSAAELDTAATRLIEEVRAQRSAVATAGPRG